MLKDSAEQGYTLSFHPPQMRAPLRRSEDSILGVFDTGFKALQVDAPVRIKKRKRQEPDRTRKKPHQEKLR
jgi:hypothetical protein